MQKLDLVAFGETMIRLSPNKPFVLEQGMDLQMNIAGSELSVCCDASRLGMRTTYVTCLADDPLGRYVAAEARRHGVGVDHVVYAPQRQGLMFFEHGISPRPGVVYYDRLDSAITSVDEGTFDWENILLHTNIFHTSGITLAIGHGVSAAAEQALRVARDLPETIVSFDMNYRSKLGSPEQALNAFERVHDCIDVLFLSGGDAQQVLNLDHPVNAEVSRIIAERYTIPVVCVMYNDDASENAWVISCYADGSLHNVAQKGPITTIDRLGAGDAFAAGFLSFFLEDGTEKALRSANAMMVLKNTYPGDVAWVTRDLLESYLSGSNDTVIR